MMSALFWTGAITSSVIDNVPEAITIGYLIEHLIPSITYSFTLLVWGSSLGLDIGGNFTPIGASANVAGAIAEIIGRKFLPLSEEIFIENGGDIFMNLKNEVKIGIYAGKSPFSMKIGIKIKRENPAGIATSSGTVGHSFSYGDADAVTIISNSSAFSDGAATYFGNLIKSRN